MGPLDFADLPERALLLVDSAPIIYVLEAHPQLWRRLRAAVRCARGGKAALCGDNRYDCRGADRPVPVRQYRPCTALSGYPRSSRQCVELNIEIAESAARLCASLRLRLADAVQAQPLTERSSIGDARPRLLAPEIHARHFLNTEDGHSQTMQHALIRDLPSND